MTESDKLVRRQRGLLVAYKKVFATPEGKKVLYDLMHKYHFFDKCKDLVEEGERRVVCDIYSCLKMSVERFDELVAEQLKQGE